MDITRSTAILFATLARYWNGGSIDVGCNDKFAIKSQSEMVSLQ
jgi:hypothetical protein